MNAVGKLFAVSLAMFFVFGALPTHAVTPQEYVGAYFTNQQATATKAFLENDFSGTNPSIIPSTSWLGSVLSIAGQSSSSPCPCLYQTGFQLYPNNTVQATSQFYGAQSNNPPLGCIYCAWIKNVGTVSAFDYDGEINYKSSCSCIQSSAYVYSTLTQVENNSPNIYRFSGIYTGDVTNPFYYGITTNTSCYAEPMQRYQAGLESPNIGSGAWYVNQRVAEVYASGWLYQPANSDEGNLSYITCYNGQSYVVGGAQMTGVNVNSANLGTDSPSWKYTGTTIGQDKSLWTGSGGTTPYPCQVSGRC